MVQQTLFKKSNSVSSSSKYIKRLETIFKKAGELSILCAIEVCLIIYGSNGELKIWPKDRKRVEAMVRRYWALSDTQRRKRNVSLHEFREKNDKEKVIRVSKVKYPVWEFDNYNSVEQLTVLFQSFERALNRFHRRVHAVVEAKGQREIPNRNMMTTTMNHLQQQSNQVSAVPFNHGNGNISQIPVPASALNQGQSLAPIPPELMIYPDVGNYSDFGVQGALINGFQNMNMNTNMHSRNNFNVEDYNSYSVNGNSHPHKLVQYPTQQHYNNNYSVNANSHSHQFVQYPTQHPYNNNNYIVNANSLSHQLVQYPTQQQNWDLNSNQYGNNIRSFHDHA